MRRRRRSSTPTTSWTRWSTSARSTTTPPSSTSATTWSGAGRTYRCVMAIESPNTCWGGKSSNFCEFMCVIVRGGGCVSKCPVRSLSLRIMSLCGGKRSKYAFLESPTARANCTQFQKNISKKTLHRSKATPVSAR